MNNYSTLFKKIKDNFWPLFFTTIFGAYLLFILVSFLYSFGSTLYNYFFVKETNVIEKVDVKNFRQVEADENKIKLDEFARKYEASADWQEEIKYTIQLQSQDIANKNFLFQGKIKDIFIRDKKTFISFESDRYFTEIECSESIINALLDNKWSDNVYLSGKFAVIAKISKVSKLVVIEDGYQSKSYIKGNCVDIIRIGDNDHFSFDDLPEPDIENRFK